MTCRTWRRNGWSVWHLWGAMTLLGLGVVATSDAWSDILHIAIRDQESSHLWLLPIVVVWLVWVRRRRLGYCRPEGLWIGPVVVSLGWIMYCYGASYSYQVLWHGGAVLLAAGCLLSVAGKSVLTQLVPAFVVLALFVPLPGRARQVIAIPIETASAQATETCFEVLGVSVERSGNVLSLNSHDVAITEASNGVRMVLSLAAVAFAFAFGTPLREYARAVILLACPISAIICNVVCLIPTVWAYANLPVRAADLFHDVSGWLMLAVAFLLLLGVLRVLRWVMVPVTQYSLAYD